MITPVEVVATDGQETLDINSEPSPVNFTVAWPTNGSGNPQAPDAENVTALAFASGFPVDLTPVGNVTVIAPYDQRTHCSLPAYTGARNVLFGVDRHYDTESSEGNASDRIDETLQFFTVADFSAAKGETVAWLDFYDEGESGPGFGPSLENLWREDELIARLDQCVVQPSDPGWYRWYGYINGSNDGQPRAPNADNGDPEDDTPDWRTEEWWGDDPDESAAAYSNWYYVCECEDRREAELTLGLPPQYHPHRNSSVRAPNYIQDGEPQRDLNLTLYAPGSKDRLPPPEATRTPTPTAIPTSTPTSADTPTPSPTPSPASDSGASGFGILATVLALVTGLTVLCYLD